MNIENEPDAVPNEIKRICSMAEFKEELLRFFDDYGLPSSTFATIDGWSRFLSYYARIIEDCPLEIRQDRLDSGSGKVVRITINVEAADRVISGEAYYKVNWRIIGRDGASG